MFLLAHLVTQLTTTDLIQQIKGVPACEIGKNIGSILLELIRLRKAYPNVSTIRYLNINHFKTKVTSIREICGQTHINILCIDQTKLDPSYPDSQSLTDDYQFPSFCRDENK